MTHYRALTLKQPWPWAICYAGKRIENRTWPIPRTVSQLPCGYCTISPGWTDRSTREANNARSLGLDRSSSLLVACENCSGVNSDDETVTQPGTGIVPLRVLIHAGKQWDHDAEQLIVDRVGGQFVRAPRWRDVGYGMHHSQSYMEGGSFDVSMCWVGSVVAVATITGSHTAHSAHCLTVGHEPPVSMCSPWAMSSDDPDKTMHHWELDDVTVLPEPITGIKGNPGLWKPDAELIQAVEAQLKGDRTC